MDWMNKGVRPAQANVGHSPETAAPRGSRTSTREVMKFFKIGSVSLLFSCTILILALVSYIAFGNNTSSEKKYVEPSKYQAVFINGGQVYFGHIQALNDKYISMSDIYYLRVNQQVQPKAKTSNDNVSLVKLGCELHGPEDRMTINRDQVTFWENLKDDGQVAKAVATFKKQNPNGQNCATQQSSTPTSSTTGQ